MAESPNFEKASLAWTLTWDADWVTAVRFLGSSRKVAAGNNLGQIMLWDLPEKAGDPVPAPQRRLDGHTNVITHLVATGDGRWLISSSNDHSIRYWDSQAGATGNETVVLNDRARRDAEARRNNGAKVPEKIEAQVAIQKPAQLLAGHKDWIVALAMSKDESLLLSGDDKGEIVLWDRPAGKEIRRWKTKGWAYAAAISPDNKQALVTERIPLIFDSGRMDAVKLYDLATGQVQKDLSADFKGQHICSAAYSPDGKLLALGRGGEANGNNGKVYLVDPETGKKVRELAPGHQDGMTDLAWHPDGVHLASAGRDTLVRIWNSADGKLVKEVGKARGGQFKDWVCAVSFSADGNWLAAADMAGAVQVYSLQ